MRTSEVEKRLRLLTGEIERLQARVTQLERIANPDVPEILRRQWQKPKGRKPKLRTHVLLSRREKLVDLFESNWPELSRDIRQARKAEHLAEAVKRLPKRAGGYDLPLL